MFKSKKILLGLGMPLALASVGFLVSCSQEAPFQRNELYKKVRTNGARQVYDFEHDSTLRASSILSDLTAGATPSLLRMATSGKTKIQSNGTIDEYSFEFLKLEYAKEVFVTKSDGTIVVYDNDETDASTATDTTYKGVKKLGSNNVKSINNVKFYQDLENAKSISFSIKENQFWVNSKGEKTKYQISVEDFYTKISRLFSLDKTSRYKRGGSKESDDIQIAKFKFSPTNQFLETGDFANAYLINLVGIDANKLEKKSNVVKNLNHEQKEYKVLNFDGFKKEGGDIKEFVNTVLVQTDFFSAAPSEFIKEKNAEKNPTGVSGEAASNGIYWYGAKLDETLFAGYYYVEQFTDKRISLKQNKHYLNQEWVKDPASVKVLITEYSQEEASTFNTKSFENYKNNTQAFLDFNLLNQNQKSEILKNSDKFNLNYKFVNDRNDQSDGFWWSSNPFPTEPGKDKDGKQLPATNFTYNDNLSKLLYGKKTSELNGSKDTDGKEQGSQLSKHFWTSESLVFRNLLANSFNLYKYAQTVDENSIYWLPYARPLNKLSGKDGLTSELQSLSDKTEDSNTIFSLKLDYSKLDTKNAQLDEKYSKENIQDNQKSTLSSNFSKIKEEMKKLLDAFYSKNGLASTEKLELNLFDVSSNTPSKNISATKLYVDAINLLDSRLNFKYNSTWDDSNSNIISGQKTPFVNNGWHIDYDGFGGWLNFLFFPHRRYAHWTSLIAFAELDDENQLKKTFPHFAELAKSFKEKLKTLETKGMRKYDEIVKATNVQVSNLNIEFLKGDPKFTTNDVYHEYFNFVKDFQTSKNNEQLLELQKEINSLFVTLPGMGARTTKITPEERLVNKHYDVPLGSNHFVSAIDYKINK